MSLRFNHPIHPFNYSPQKNCHHFASAIVYCVRRPQTTQPAANHPNPTHRRLKMEESLKPDGNLSSGDNLIAEVDAELGVFEKFAGLVAALVGIEIGVCYAMEASDGILAYLWGAGIIAMGIWIGSTVLGRVFKAILPLAFILAALAAGIDIFL